MDGLEIIGRDAYVDFTESSKNIAAKIDTGADNSTVWASNIHIDENGELVFCLFGERSPYYTGELLKAADFKKNRVRSSSGHQQVRYKTNLTIQIARKRLTVPFSLSDRKSHKYPVLIGRSALENNFLVDVSKRGVIPNSKVNRGIL